MSFLLRLFAIGVAFSFCALGCKRPSAEGQDAGTLKVGILHSLTGTMAISETAVVDATQLAIQQINAKGGLLGKKLEAVVADGGSDASQFAQRAEQLIIKDKVAVIFGCWTSASRKTVIPVVEKYQHLLFYPVQYEGLEQSRHVIYTGAAPNQQIIPAIKWALANVGKRMFLVGSDYVFPRTANEIIKALLEQSGGQVVGEEYLLLGSSEVADVTEKIASTQPDIIVNTINGDTNIHFFKSLRARGVTPQRIPTMNFSIAEAELAAMGTETMIGDYATWNYFQSLETPENAQFIKAFRARYGAHRVTDDPMEAGFVGVHLWASAVNEANSVSPSAVRLALANQTYIAPQGSVHVDGENNHTWKISRIGKIVESGQFEVIWSSGAPIQPRPFPPFKDRAEWESFLSRLNQRWNGAWANPGQ